MKLYIVKTTIINNNVTTIKVFTAYAESGTDAIIQVDSTQQLDDEQWHDSIAFPVMAANHAAHLVFVEN